MENFIRQLLSKPSGDMQNDDLLAMAADTQAPTVNDIKLTRKVMIFTRTSSYVIGLHEQSNRELFGGLISNEYTDDTDHIDILNLVSDHPRATVDCVIICILGGNRKFHGT